MPDVSLPKLRTQSENEKRARMVTYEILKYQEEIPVNVAVTSVETHVDIKRFERYTLYRIATRIGGITSIVTRRYKEFCDLRSILDEVQVFIDSNSSTIASYSVILPELPPKTILKSKFSSSVVQYRKKHLEVFLRELFYIPELKLNPTLLAFVGCRITSRGLLVRKSCVI